MRSYVGDDRLERLNDLIVNRAASYAFKYSPLSSPSSRYFAFFLTPSTHWSAMPFFLHRVQGRSTISTTVCLFDRKNTHAHRTSDDSFDKPDRPLQLFSSVYLPFPSSYSFLHLHQYSATSSSVCRYLTWVRGDLQDWSNWRVMKRQRQNWKIEQLSSTILVFLA